MKKETPHPRYFTKTELSLWGTSTLAILSSFFIFDESNHLTLLASLIGVTAIILNAKGNPAGQALMIVFSLLYGIISYSFAYYGEMITYLGMTMPMAAFALVSWLRHPYAGRRSEVEVYRIHGDEVASMLLAAVLVTILFYHILRHFHTANIVPSTLSVTTSFIAVYLTYKRSPYFSIAYAANDVVLIALWVLASMTDARYISVTVCFAAFLCNDLYAFANWQTMEKRQAVPTVAEASSTLAQKKALSTGRPDCSGGVLLPCAKVGGIGRPPRPENGIDAPTPPEGWRRQRIRQGRTGR